MPDFIGRAGEKLDLALREFGIDVAGRIVCDLGSNVGGFVDCLLQRGAAKVYSVDTSYGTLDWKLRQDTRVVVMERTNAMHVELPERVDLVTIDVGWTRQEKVVPHAMSLLAGGGRIVSLVKTQYEAAAEERTDGVVTDGLEETVIARVRKKLAALGATIEHVIESPYRGQKGGNREFFFLVGKP